MQLLLQAARRSSPILNLLPHRLITFLLHRQLSKTITFICPHNAAPRYFSFYPLLQYLFFTSYLSLLQSSSSMMLNMSCSPSTPEKPTVARTIDAESHAGPVKSMSASKTNQTLVQEPSPASTYGETAVGDSVPATPQESALGGKFGLSCFLDPVQHRMLCPPSHWRSAEYRIVAT